MHVGTFLLLVSFCGDSKAIGISSQLWLRREKQKARLFFSHAYNRCVNAALNRSQLLLSHINRKIVLQRRFNRTEFFGVSLCFFSHNFLAKLFALFDQNKTVGVRISAIITHRI